MLASNRKTSPGSSSSRGRPELLCLIILDGWGISPCVEGNAIATAGTPNMDALCRRYPRTDLAAAGEAVGLPSGQMGNSEVGHLNIGAGRIVYQDFTRINKAIGDGEFLTNPVLVDAVKHAKQAGGRMHLMGLLSDGGVHSHAEHLYALIGLAKRQGLADVWVHAFLDGRDVPPQSAPGYIERLEAKMTELGVGRVATISGRYYAMDRDRRWERTKAAYDAIVYGEGESAPTALAAVERSYAQGVVDEFVKPTVVVSAEEQKSGSAEGQSVRDGDSCIFFNFRPDRARQLTRAFIDKAFDAFDRGPRPPEVFFVTMTEYDATFAAPIVFQPVEISHTLSKVLSEHGLKQLHIAETEKYAHVTFFFNGGVEAPEPGEERILVPSPKVDTYDLKPEMSAFEVTRRVVEAIRARAYDVIIINYANADMVGHTAVFNAAIRAIEVVDECVGRVFEEVSAAGGVTIVTADHGNADQEIDCETGRPFTAHTTNPVPFILAMANGFTLRGGGVLADIAPTILDILHAPQPAEMTGRTLIERG